MKTALLVTSIISIAAMISWFILEMIKDLRSTPSIKTKLKNLSSRFTALKVALNDDSQYLRFSDYILRKEELATLGEQARELRNTLLRKEIKALTRQIENCETDLPNLRARIIERFLQQEKARAKHIFNDEEGNELLTEEQVRAVLLNDNRNLIVAGAGSGKTRVIDFKIRYLVNYKNIAPRNILILSFSKKSVGELVNKISVNISGIEARTIHSFASYVIGRHDRKLFDHSNKEFESIVIKALVQTLTDKSVFRLFWGFYEKFFSDIKPLIFYKNLDDLREDLKKQNSKLIDLPDRFGEVKARRAIKTLKGEYVRSVDEKYIADFLYLQEIKYEYEKKYPQSEEWYFPDFYLPDYDVYLEHFAITSSGEPPEYFDSPQKYLKGMQWKRELHKKNGTRMIESYSFLLNAGETSLYLAEVLNQNGIEARDHLESDEAYRKISQELCRLFTKFYRSLKQSGLSLTELKHKYTEPKYSLFLHTFEIFLGHAEGLVAKENKMEFNDMIIDATAKYKEEGVRLFDYIIVDEFQDTSNLAMKLLDKVYQSNPHATFLSVGDDWQSIYGFNGSDVTILSGYAKRYPGVSVQNLDSNFRSHAKIVALAKQFISRNPAQIPKNSFSRSNKFRDSDIDFLSFECMEEKIETIPDHESIFVLYRYNDDCPASLGAFREFFILDKTRKPIRRANCRKNISMMTIHASKGLEAQHVFLLFPDGLRRKFPSEIEDHFVFNMLKSNFDDFPFSEERRLMYVAITRAEQNLYFVSPNKDPNSVFWDELKELVRAAGSR